MSILRSSIRDRFVVPCILAGSAWAGITVAARSARTSSAAIFWSGVPSLRLAIGLVWLAILPSIAVAQTNFGSVSLGSSTTAAVTITIPSAATLGSIAVLTQGAPNLDFTNAGTGTCTAGTAYAAGATCTVGVTFAPEHAGTRYGAVVLQNANGLIVEAYLQGSGGVVTGPLAVFMPGLQSSIGSGFLVPVGVAVDSGGNVYVTDAGNAAVYKETLSSGVFTQTTIGSGFVEPRGIAVDGYGNVYIADAGLRVVIKETLSAGQYSQSEIGGFIEPNGLAVDGGGNLYVSDLVGEISPSLYKETLANGLYTQTTIAVGFNTPQGVAVDGAGNVYIGDQYAQTLYKETLSNGVYTQTAFLSTAQPTGVAVDGDGNVYVAEYGGGTYLVEIPSNGSYVPEPYGSYAAAPFSIAVDGSGNVYALAQGLDSGGSDYPPAVSKFTAALPPTLNFGSTSAYGAGGQGSNYQTVTVANYGSASLSFSSVVYPTDFPETSSIGSDCNSSTALSIGTFCTLSIHFAPQELLGSAPYLVYNEDVTVTTNTGNTPGTEDTIAVTGTELHQPSGTIVFAPSPATLGSPVTLTATVTAADGFNGETPTGTAWFFIDDLSVGSPIPLSGGVATYTTSTLSAGTHTALFYYSGDSDFLNGYFYSAVSESIVAAPPSSFFGDTTIGNVNVGSTANLIPLTVTFNTAETLSSIAVVTEGAPNLDFTDAGGGTCATGTAYAAGATCTVDVAFAPKYAGARYGAVVLTSASNGVVGTGFLQGTGVGAQIAFGPVTATAIDPTVNGKSLSDPFGMAVDEAGDLFIADSANSRVVEVPAGGAAPTAIDPTLNGESLLYPYGTAVDGAGNLFIVDTENSRVVEVPAGGGTPISIAPTVNSGGLLAPTGVAVDGAGDLFIADLDNSRVVEVPVGGGAPTAIDPTVNGKSLSEPYSMAVDGAGDLFIADTYNGRVVEVPAGGGAPTAIDPTVNGTGLLYPTGVALDAAGDLFIADYSNSRVVAVPAGGGAPISIDPTVNGTGLSYPTGVALDGAGDLFIADYGNSRVVEVELWQPPALIFPTSTAVGTTDTADGPQTVQVYNIGNELLDFTAVSYPADFFEAGKYANDCIGSTSLSAGQECILPVVFTPQNVGSLIESVTLTDNVLNVTGATQSIVVSGNGIAANATPTATPTFSLASGTYTTVQTVHIADATSAAKIYYSLDGSTPTTSSLLYTGTITISASETIKAIAVAPGFTQSTVATATYTLNLPQASAPGFSLNAGSYPTTQTVIISDPMANATIYYTTNGSAPTTNSMQYTGPITVSTSEILTAAAIAPGYSMSYDPSVQYIIGTSATSLVFSIAGSGHYGYSGDGGLATLASIQPNKAVFDSAGNMYIADSNFHVRKVAGGTGVITSIAGNGTNGYSGDGGPAIEAGISYFSSIALDAMGNLYIADSGNNVIRKVNLSTGIITTYAGNGFYGFNGDGETATNAELASPSGVSLDGVGNLYIADTNNQRIRMISAATGDISTVAGNGSAGYSGDGGLATNASINSPLEVFADSIGNLYIADTKSNVIRKVSVGNGKMSTVAGNGTAGFSGDGGIATSAKLNQPSDIALDTAGNLYIADFANSVIRKVTASNQIITSVAGIEGRSCQGQGLDGGLANGAIFCNADGITVDTAGNLYLADNGNARVRKITTPGLSPTTATPAPIFSLPAGTYASPQTATISDTLPSASIYYSMDGSTPNGQYTGFGGSINVSGTVTVSAIAIAPGYLPSNAVAATYTITSAPATVIDTFAGNGVYGFTGFDGAATSAEVGYPQGVAIDGSGNVYFADNGNNVVWMVAAQTGDIATIAGNGTAGYSGDGGLGTNAELNDPDGVVADNAGNLYIADLRNNAVRRVDAISREITTVAGNGQSGYSGDGGPAIYAQLNSPTGLVLDSTGNLYVSDSNNSVIRKVSISTGVITTFAGNGNWYSGDGGPAISAGIPNPQGMAFDGSGNLYVVDNSPRIRKIEAVTGIITTVAGNGAWGGSGDGGPATSAEISANIGGGTYLAFDAANDLYLSSWDSVVRMISANTQIISTVVGNGIYGFFGDGGSATLAEMTQPSGIAFDVAGNLYIADSVNSRIREVSPPNPAPSPVFSLATGTYYGVQTVTITDPAPGATIYFTTDGSTPRLTSSIYGGPITVSATEKLQAIALTRGYTPSGVTSATYTFPPPAPTPTFSEGTGIYATAQTVTIGDAIAGAPIYYTLDGSTPTTNSNVYGGAITVSSSETLKAMATATGYAPSAVASASYDITQIAASGTLEWTWMGGSGTIGSNCVTTSPGEPWQMTVCGQAGVYGTLGVPAAGNIPGSRVSPTTWADKNGNLWLFGGQGFDANGQGGSLNDLWEFNPSTNLWAWMGGSSTAGQAGVYGTRGTASAGNIPGGRFSAAAWTDNSGNVWLFGGGSAVDANGTSGYLNDLWEFNPTTGLWAWMGGNSTVDSTGGEVGVYGTLGTPAAGNIPGGRSSTATWTDERGNFWLFGGQGTDADGNFTSFGDLWELNTSTLQWAWMGGNILLHCGSNGCQQSSVYGSLGTPAAGNFPGTRASALGWTDKSGNFWMFGGDSGNDLWEFNPSTNLWAWMGGSGTQNCSPSGCAINGVYGTLGTPSAGNFPGAHTNSSYWTDNSGNLWLFAGSGTDANGVRGELNDLWKFNPSANQWTWMGGSSTIGSFCFNYYGSTLCGQAGVYGTLGVPTGGDIPGSRDSATGSAGSATWTDQSGNFWLFGGNAVDANGNNGYLNDMWRYQTTAVALPVTATPVFGLASGSYINVGTLAITDATSGASIYYTTDGTTPTTASTLYIEPIQVSATETVQAIAVAPSHLPSTVAAATYAITLPVTPSDYTFAPVSIGSPSPELSVLFTFNTRVTLGSTAVLTQGATGLDFSNAGTGTCVAGTTYTAGETCTVNVTFTPRVPGLRLGAAVLYDTSENVLATGLISGTGVAPQAAFRYVYGSTAPPVVISNSSISDASYSKMDSAGNLFLSININFTQVQGNGSVLEFPASGSGFGAPVTLASGTTGPQGIALDGAGNLYVVSDADLNYDPNSGSIVELAKTAAGYAPPVTVASGLNYPNGLAIDGSGNLFYASYSGGLMSNGANTPNTGGVVELPWTGVGFGAPVTLASGLSFPGDLALDAAGDLFVIPVSDSSGDAGSGSLLELTKTVSGYGSPVTVASGLSFPFGIAVDPSGTLFVSLSSDSASIPANTGSLIEIPVTASGYGQPVTLATALNFPTDVVVDGSGNILVLGYNTDVYRIPRATAPSLSFATTYVGATSSDSPQSFTPQNIGNQTLSAVSPGLVVSGPNFIQVPGLGTPADCTSTFSLAPGADCNLSISFTPQSPGSLGSSAVFTDNALNNSPSSQSVSLSGGALEPIDTLTLTGSGTGSGSVSASPTGINCSVIAGATSGTCSSSYPGGTLVSMVEVPSPGSTFVGWGGACASQGTNQLCNVTLNAATSVSANFALATTYALAVTVVGNGTGTVTDNLTQISCSDANGVVAGTCSGSYSSGTSVTLTANVTGTTTFAGWGGACASSGASAFCTVTMNSAQSVSASFVAPGTGQSGTLKPITAGVVYGQGGSFTSNTANNGGVSANSLFAHGNMAFDRGGNLYVADAGNNRVLFYPAGSTTATRVYGQNGSFTTNTANNDGVNANSLADPQGVALDSSGNLYVADESNNRVLFYPAGSTTATRVYGQGGSFATAAANNGGVSANSMDLPFEVAVDSSGGLYVADYGNSRVLYYPSGSTTATRVYGQGGSFTSNTANNGGVSANSLDQPTGVALDSSGDLYVADIYNNRVLFYPSGSTTATQVYGQIGNFTTNNPDNGGISANSLNNPLAVAVDSNGDLYVVDRSNNRALFYPFGSTTATRVYGQLNSFTSGTANNGGVSANSLSQPFGEALDNRGNLYVSDYSNNRVLEYGSFGNVNVCPAGQTTPAPCSNTISLSYYAASTTDFGATQVVTQGVSGLDFSLGSGSTCTGTMTGGSSCSVNVNFAPLAPGSRLGAVQLFDNSANLLTTAPIYGIGQGPVSAFGPGTQTTVNTGSFPLSNPRGVLVDAAGNLFVSDVGNQEVLKIAPNGSVTTVGFGFQFPQGMAEDGAGDLFVADNNLNEVVEIPAGCASVNCQVYLGSNLRAQLGVAIDGAGDVFFGDFLDGEVVEIPAGCTSNACQKVVYSPGTGSNPVGLTADGAGDLFVADYGLKTVEEVPAGCTTTGCTIPIGTGWQQPDSIAVDAAGDVFVADAGLDEVVAVPAGCTNPACQAVVVSGVDTVAVALDASGDLVVDDLVNRRIFEVNRSQPPSWSFALTNVGSTSSDSPQLVSIQNVGNQLLTGSAASTLGTNFTQNETSTCGSGFSLTPGAACSESFSFTPQSTGYLSGTAAFSDNTFNLSPLVVLQTINLSGIGGVNGQAVTTAVPNVVGLTQAAGTTAISGAGLTPGNAYTASSDIVPTGSVIASNPAAGTQVSLGSEVKLLVSSGQAPPPAPNPLTFENNYFVTGDYAAAGVTLRGTGVGGMATGTITIADSTTNPGVSQGVPDGADILDGFLYWETLENTPSPSANTGTFLGYSIVGQQIGSDIPYTDGAFSGTLRVYRADVNTYFPIGANGIRFASGAFRVSLPDSGGTALPLTEGASLVVIYRVLSPNFPLKSVVIYDGSGIPASSTTQNIQGFYDAVGGASGTGENTTLYYAGGSWNNNFSSVTLGQSNQYSAPLNAGNAYAAVILSTPVNNSDNDGILDAWKTGPPANDFYGALPGYYDVKTGSWVPLPGAKHGEKDLFVQLDYMCGAVLADGSCDPSQENLFPAPDAQGNDPLAMVRSAFAASGAVLHLEVGNAVPESTCTDNLTTNPPQLCQFPGEPGVIGWKNSLEFSKLWPRNFASCAAGGDCSPRFPYGQKDSYHYVLFGHSLAIPAWNSRYASLTSIQVVNGTTTIVTTDRGAGINACPGRITIAGVQGNPNLNGVYNTSSCADTKTITLATPGVPNWNYPNNTLPEPAIGITSGTVTSISGYSDLGGADSAVTLALWETNPNQDMSKRSNVIAGTLFHEIGHTLGLSHGGLYYDTPGSYIPTFEANCKPNYQSVMNYLFQLDLVGPNAAVAFSNQTLNTLYQASLGSVTQLTDASNNPATYPTSAWYVPYTAGTTTASPATLHCDGTPLDNDSAYRVDASVAPITPPWSNGQNITFDGVPYTQLRGYNDVANSDLRQVGATGGEFASLASVLSFGSSSSPLNVAAGGTVALGSGGTIALGSGGTVTLGSGGNVTLGSSGIIALGSGGIVTLGSGGNVTLGSGGVVTPGSNGIVGLPSGGPVALSSGGIIALGSGGIVTLGSGGVVTLGSGGVIALGSGGNVTIPSTGGSYTIPNSGGTITLGGGGTVALGSGGIVTLGSGGTITGLASGGNVILGSGGVVALGSGGSVATTNTLSGGGIVALGSGGNVTLGSGGNVTLGSGGTITLGSGGTIAMGSGGNVALGSGGIVTLGSGGNLTVGSGGNVTLGSGGTVALGSGGNVTLGSGGIIAMGSGGTVALGSGGTVTLGSGGATINGVTEPAGTYTVSSGGVIALGSGGTVALGSGGNVTLGGAGVITMGSGGTVTLGSGGNVTLGSGGIVALGSGGTVALGSGGTVALGSGGTITLGSGGATSTELTYETANSVVRPPTSPTETPTPEGIRVDWTSAAFGVVSNYTILRSSSGATSIVIGGVSGVNGFPPATTFTDTNPDLTSQTVVYTITTTLVPDPGGSQRQSPQSAPAVLKNDQAIILGPLPSSVSISSSLVTVTATAVSSGAANGLQVSFSTTGACSIESQSISSGVSSATVTLNGTGSCTVTASQAGNTGYNSANPVSGIFTILPQGSNTQSQTITFPQLQNVQYGGTFSLSASSSSALQVSFSASGPCTTGGATTGVGLCTITASAPANSTYSAASVSQSFTVFPAVIKVTATNLTNVYGQALPALTYSYSGFVNGDTAAAVSGAPALSTTATASSSPGGYPIAVSTGTLATTNYSFLYVSGTLTIQPATPTIGISNLPGSALYGGSFAPTYLYSGSGSPTESVASTTTSVCAVSGGVVNYVGLGTCTLTASASATTDYAAVTGSPQSFTVGQATPTISINNIPASAVYGGSFTPTYLYSGNGSPTESAASTTTGVCTVSGGVVNYVGLGTCTLTASASATTDFAAVTGSPQSFTVGQAMQSITFTQPTSPLTYGISPITLSASATSGLTVAFSIDSSSTGTGTISGGTLTITGAGTLVIDANQAGNIDYQAAAQVQRSIAVNKAAQTIAFTTNPPASAAYNSSFTVAATATSGLAVAFTSSGSCSNSGATYTMTNSTGTCSVIASQAGNANYTAATATAVTKAVSATGPAITVSPSTIDFGKVYLDSITAQSIKVSNTGTATATIHEPLISILQAGSSDEFVIVNLCPTSLAAGKSCTIEVFFFAGAYYSRPQTATLNIMDNAPGSPQPVALTATVIDPLASFSPTSLSFGTVKHATSSTRDVTLSNPGATPLIFSGAGIAVTGMNAADFTQTNNCGSSLAAGASCTIAVKFTPRTTGTFSASLTVVDNARAGSCTQTVALSGKGD